MSQIKPEAFLKAMKEVSKAESLFKSYSCNAVGKHGGKEARAAYNEVFRPDDHDRDTFYKDYKVDLGGNAWMHEWDPVNHNKPALNKSTLLHERLTFLAMAHALAEAGDLGTF